MSRLRTWTRRRLGALRGERGVAVPTVVWVMFILLGVGLATTAVAIAGLSQAGRDRHVKRSMAAADSGADVAGWRMNHVLVAELDDGLLKIDDPGKTFQDVLKQGCISVSALNIDVLDTTGYTGAYDAVLPDATLPWCTPQAHGTSEQLGDGSSYEYWVSSSVRVLSGSASLLDVLRRKVVVIGRSAGVQRRVLVAYDLAFDVLANGTWDLVPDRLFERTGWVECPPQPTGAAPDSGCPALPAPEFSQP